MDSSIRALVEAGAAVILLGHKEKSPCEKAWSQIGRRTIDEILAVYRSGMNFGVNLGMSSCVDGLYLHAVDLDIRNVECLAVATKALRSYLPNYASLPSVISGSGGHSRHIYFFSREAFSKKVLVKEPGWEIVLMGTGSQVVLPPSIHPNGKPYAWERSIDLDMPFLMEVEVERIKSWGVSTTTSSWDEDEDNYLIGEVESEPLDLTEEQIDDILAHIPNTGDGAHYDEYTQVGMAIHHQYRGSEEGYAKFLKWASQSDKFIERNVKERWKSFGKRKRGIVRMATLIAISSENKLQSNLPSVIARGNNDDLADLLGNEIVSLGPKKVQIDPNWSSLLDRNEDGMPKNVLHNITLIVKNDIRTHGTVALNEFSSELVLINKPNIVSKKRDNSKDVVNLTTSIWEVEDPVNGRIWTDSHDHDVRGIIEAPATQGGYGMKVSDRDLKAALDRVANQNQYHPVRNYLKAVQWDGVKRMERLFVDYLKTPDTAYHREAARLFLLGAVVRVFEPGHKFDFVPILEGAQGKRKSTFIRILGRGWFSELSGDFHNNAQMVEQIQGSWIVEIPELQGFSKADTNVLKAWISRQFDKARLAYDRRARVFPRQCVFFGSTNDKEYLRDHTGGRRFWPIECGLGQGEEIDTVRLEAEIDMVWAEAYAMYKEMRQTCKLKELPLYFQGSEALAEAKMLQESRRLETAEDSLMGEIEAWLDEPIGTDPDFDDLDPQAPKVVRNFTCVAQIWTEMMGRDKGAMSTIESTKIGKALARLDGWERISEVQRRTKRYGKQRVYKRSSFTSLWNEEL